MLAIMAKSCVFIAILSSAVRLFMFAVVFVDKAVVSAIDDADPDISLSAFGNGHRLPTYIALNTNRSRMLIL